MSLTVIATMLSSAIAMLVLKRKADLPEDRLRIIEIGQAIRQRLADTSIPLHERAQTDIKFFDWRIMFTEVFNRPSGENGFDIVIGNNKKKDLIQILDAFYEEKQGAEKAVIDINHTYEYERMHLNKTAEHTRAYIKVQDGCNQFCTYCIIPFARGRVRSRAKMDVVQEVTELAANGYQEVVLTGIHLSSYGVDLEGENLLSLILEVNKIEGIKRIRLGSLEPRIITEEFVKTISGLEKICPHFHLSLQSGCDETLRRMNRRYASQEYYEKCMLLRKYFVNPALTTDVIVGFPGETEEEFKKSKEFVDKVDFYETHIFKYSKREGTKAAVMDDQISELEKTARSNELLALDQKKREKYEEQFVGTTVEVLMEEQVEIGGETYQVGHTKEYVKVALKTEDNLQNQLVDIQIDNHSQIIH